MLLAIFILIFATFSMAQDNVCSQVQLMSQYCASQGVNVSGSGDDGRPVTITFLEEQMNTRFRDIETRLIREFGKPPEVNYTAVEETIIQRFKGVEARVIQQLGEPPEVNYTAIEQSIQQRFEKLEALVNEGDEEHPSIVNYSRIDLSIEAKFKALQVHIDSKFAKLVNDTELYQEAVEEMNRRINVSDCREIRKEDAKICNATGGVFDIYRGTKKYEVFCDTFTDGGGWTVFLRRHGLVTDFRRNLTEYVNGFGDRSGEFWLGLQNIRELLQSGTYELRIDTMNSLGYVRFAKYGYFHIAGATRAYEINVNSYHGDWPDEMTNLKGSSFSICPPNYGGWWRAPCSPYTLTAPSPQRYRDSPLIWAEMKFRRTAQD